MPVSVALAQETSPIVQQTVDLAGVKAVAVNGNFKIVLTQGLDEGMQISAPEEVMPKIVVKQSKTKVEVSVKGKLKQNYAPFAITVTLNEPEQIVLGGVAEMKVGGGLACGKMSVEMTGNATFRGDIQTTDEISVKMSDRTEMQGSLTSTKAEKVILSGYAKMDVRGHTPAFTLTQSNNTRFGSRDFNADKATVKMSDMSAAGFTINKALTATVSDGAVLNYGGMPKTKVNTSGMAKAQAF